MSDTGYRDFHMCLDIRGVLCLSDKELVRRYGGMIEADGRKLHGAFDIRNAFFDELAKGREVLPIGKCDNFDYKTGCGGHPAADSGKREEAT